MYVVGGPNHHRRFESNVEASAGTFDAFAADNADFDAVPAPPQQLQNKESFGSFHKGDFFRIGLRFSVISLNIKSPKQSRQQR